MTETNLATQSRPEITDFVASVRTQLADLDAEEQRELTDGLEADLTDLVAERGGGALGDPLAYARELRSAAGLPAEMGRVAGRRGLGESVEAVLDSCHARWDRLVDGLPGAPADFLSAVRPVWWVFRAWVAAELLAMALRSQPYEVWPTVGGSPVMGGVLLAVAVVLSVQLGRGASTRLRGALWRVCLLLLNVFALVITPLIVSELSNAGWAHYDEGYQSGWHDAAADQGPGTDKAGLYADGTWVSNIYPYDANGHPLVGVQLFNQIGQPINVVTQPEYAEDDSGNPEGQPVVSYPWLNGTTEVFNTFPLPSRAQPEEPPSPKAFSEAKPPVIGPFPLANVPEVSLPGIRSSVLAPPATH